MSLFHFMSGIKRFLSGEISTSRLIKKGLKCGVNFSRGSQVFIDPTFPFLIEIGSNVTISIRTVILSHDASTIKVCDNHIGKIGKIIIGDNVFVGANCTILPNTIIGNNSIIGAGSIVSGVIPNNVVACGNPAKVICTIDQYVKKHNSGAQGNTICASKMNLKDKEAQEVLRNHVDAGIAYID